MKKLIVSAVLLSVLGLFLSGCGTEEVDWDDFFNEYYSECVQLCKTCAEWAEMCNVEATIESCTERQWYNDTRNRDCDFYATEVTKWIEMNECNPEDRWCLFHLEID